MTALAPESMAEDAGASIQTKAFCVGLRWCHLFQCDRRFLTLFQQLEHPDAVTPCRAGQQIAGRQHSHILFAVMFENSRGRIDTGICLLYTSDAADE